MGAFQYATPLTFGALGGLFSERSGVINIGLEGMMLMGCFWGVVVSQETGSWAIGVLGAMAAGGFLGLVHAVLSIHLRANQVISGTAVNILGLGITSYGTNAIFGAGRLGRHPAHPLGRCTSSGTCRVIGDVIGGLNLMIYVAFALVIVSWWFLFRTTWGLRLRAVGEHPRAADTVGIPVFRVRYLAVTLSGVLAGMGGAYLAFGLGSQFSENMTARPRLHRARRADLRQVEALGRCSRPRSCSASRRRSATRCRRSSTSTPSSSSTCRTSSP